MPGGPVGFGANPEGYGPSGQYVDQPIGNPEDQLVNDIHAIKARYCDGATNRMFPLQFTTAYDTQLADMTGQEVNCIMLTVTTGVIYGYLYDVTNNRGIAPANPDFVCSAGVVPSTVQIMIPPGETYRIGFQEASNATTTRGVARLMKI